VGAILTPLMVPLIVSLWGWRAAFYVTGALGFVWLAFWIPMYRRPREHPKLSPAELAFIESDPPESSAPVGWFELLGKRQTWAFALGKAMTDPVWWFYLFWLPKFLDVQFGIRLAAAALPIIVIYLVADVGSVFGGWFSSFLIKRGWSVNKGRKVAMLTAALMIVPTMFAPAARSLWAVVAIVSVAAAAHQWWSANLFTLSSDMFPRRAVGSIVGIGGFAGAISGFGFQRLTGAVLEANGNNYTPVFVVCGLAYVSALLLIHLIVPRLQPVRLAGDTP
jgi:ACS family hexuronate transporter-like MFS transporter